MRLPGQSDARSHGPKPGGAAPLASAAFNASSGTTSNPAFSAAACSAPGRRVAGTACASAWAAAAAAAARLASLSRAMAALMSALPSSRCPSAAAPATSSTASHTVDADPPQPDLRRPAMAAKGYTAVPVEDSGKADKSEGTKEPSRAAVMFAIGAYATCSSTMLVVNKLAVHFLPAPSIVLFAQLVSSAVAVKVRVDARRRPPPPTRAPGPAACGAVGALEASAELSDAPPPRRRRGGPTSRRRDSRVLLGA